MTTEVTTEATPAVAAPRFKPGQVPVNVKASDLAPSRKVEE